MPRSPARQIMPRVSWKVLHSFGRIYATREGTSLVDNIAVHPRAFPREHDKPTHHGRSMPRSPGRQDCLSFLEGIALL